MGSFNDNYDNHFIMNVSEAETNYLELTSVLSSRRATAAFLLLTESVVEFLPDLPSFTGLSFIRK
jgi:hypothetical protein